MNQTRHDPFRFPFYPWLAALLPLIIILAQNSGEIAPSQSLRAAAISLAFVTLALLALRRLLHQLLPAALGSSLLLLYFHTLGRLLSGHVLGPLASLIALLSPLGTASLLTLLIILLIVGMPRLNRLMEPVTILLNVISLSLLVTFGATVAINEWRILRPARPTAPITQPAPETFAPDIYYVVLDGYGRQDVLEASYGAQEFPLHDFMAENQFQLNPAARSNYMQTSLSLASTLNLDYLQNLLSPEELASGDRLLLMNLLRHNRLQQLLGQRGYRFIHLESGYRPTDLLPAQEYSRPETGGANLFERLIIENSALTLLQLLPQAPDWIAHPGYRLHRARLESALDQLVDLATEEQGGRFIFAHLLFPHPPFVFDQSGQAIQPEYPYVLLDGDAFPGPKAAYTSLYEGQRAYLDRRLIQTLNSILASSGRNAIIIIHADHGPGSELVWSSLEQSNPNERFGILMAVRSPDGNPALDPLPQTPINLLRAVLSTQLGADLSSLPDKSYFSTWQNPLEFQPVEESDIE